MGGKKYYLADFSFYYASRTDGRINYRPVLENIFHNYGFTHGYFVSTGRYGKEECDFIMQQSE